MSGPERIDPRIVDQNIDVAASEFDRFFCHLACTGCVTKIRGNKVRFASCSPNFIQRAVPAFRAAPYNQNMNTKQSELLGCGATDSARSPGDECRRTDCHVQIPRL